LIVITTPTGQIGSQTLEHVLGGGEEVRVLVRDPTRLSLEIRERVDVVTGSMDDTEVLAAAFSGAHSVFWLVPPNPRAASVAGHILSFVGPLCAAIERAGVGRVVAVSSAGHATARNAGQISAIFALDHLVESTGIDYRALCPPGFMENMLHQSGAIAGLGTFFAPVSADREFPACATRDIAAVAARLLLDPSWSGQERVPLLGPERLSSARMAEIISATLDRPVRFQQIRPEEYRKSLVQHGMSEAWAQGLVDMAAAAEGGIYDTDSPDPRYPTPTRFQDWCEEVLKPAVLAAGRA
jgi:uncharacterized protein YbjT (DUF2867 family)